MSFKPNWPLKALGAICAINPRSSIEGRGSDLAVSFVPMSDLPEGQLEFQPRQTKRMGEGGSYTYFENDDVLLAKVSPCFENGKGGVARGLVNGAGLGSTELHVLRCGDDVLPEWVYFAVQHPQFRSLGASEMTGSGGLRRLPREFVQTYPIPVPPLSEQQRIVQTLREKFANLDRARRALADQLDAAEKLPIALVRETLSEQTSETSLGDVLEEITGGVGDEWATRPLLGATRSGLALAKEPIGKSPERYKPVEAGCIFYNPMRVLIGSIAYVEEGNGIVSPDYVAFTSKSGRLHSRWFYHWLKSEFGEHFIKSLARGAVRERILFSRLADGVVSLPSWERQLDAVRQMEGAPALNRSLTDQLAALDRYPAALLREAFAGRL
jgi:hypothetical protein